MKCKECSEELTKGMAVTSNEKGIVHLQCVNGVPETHDKLLHKLIKFSEDKYGENEKSKENIDYQLGYEKCLEDLNYILDRTEFIEVMECNLNVRNVKTNGIYLDLCPEEILEEYQRKF